MTRGDSQRIADMVKRCADLADVDESASGSPQRVREAGSRARGLGAL